MNNYNEDNNETIIDELINSLDIERENSDKKVNKTANKNSVNNIKKDEDVKVEYEIVMNCDDSDYIIYYKK